MALKTTHSEHLIPGSVGNIQCVISHQENKNTFAGLVLIAHPHPLHGGTMDNKVVQTISRAFLKMNYVSIRSNFRGVGETEGGHDKGIGETDDLESVLAFAQQQHPNLPLVYAGFSFGSFVLTRLAQKVAAQRMVLVGPSVGRFEGLTVPSDTLLIHGDDDEVVPFTDVMHWARTHNLPVTVLPSATHFFHGRLLDLEGILLRTDLASLAISDITY